MKYELDLPDHIDRRLSQKATETGQDVVQLIRVAVGRFVDESDPTPSNGDWSESAEQRRRDLIDKDIAGTVTADEQAELARLDRRANEHFDRIAPPPMAGAMRLHDRLLQNRANGH
jgi:hypothetical protein